MIAYEVIATGRKDTATSDNGAIDLVGPDVSDEVVGTIELTRRLSIRDKLVEMFGGWGKVDGCYPLSGKTYANGTTSQRYNVRHDGRNNEYIVRRVN